jgi:hypothetical protein
MLSHERKLYGDELDEETERWLRENDKNFEDELRLIDKYDAKDRLIAERNGDDVDSGDPDSWRDDAMFRQYEGTKLESAERKIARRRNFDSNLSIDFK